MTNNCLNHAVLEDYMLYSWANCQPQYIRYFPLFPDVCTHQSMRWKGLIKLIYIYICITWWQRVNPVTEAGDTWQCGPLELLMKTPIWLLRYSQLPNNMNSCVATGYILNHAHPLWMPSGARLGIENICWVEESINSWCHAILQNPIHLF